MTSKNIKSIQPTVTAQVEWQALIDRMNQHTLFPFTNSWWTGGNIPGKKVQMLTYPAGINMYEAKCRETLLDFKGFEVEYADGKVETKEEHAGEKVSNVEHIEQAIAGEEVQVGA
jgi:hypothetical protein